VGLTAAGGGVLKVRYCPSGNLWYITLPGR